MRERVGKLLDTFDFVYSEIVEQADKVENPISIGVPPIMGVFMIPNMINELHLNNNEIRINVKECITEEAFKFLDDGTVDVAIVAHSGDDIPNEYKYETVYKTEFYYIVNRAHPLANRVRGVSCREINNYPLSLLTAQSYHYRAILRAFKNESVELNAEIYIRQLQTIFNLVRSGNFGTITYKEIVEMYEEDIVGIPMRTRIPVDLKVVWIKNNFMTKNKKRVIEYLLKGDWKFGKESGNNV